MIQTRKENLAELKKALALGFLLVALLGVILLAAKPAHAETIFTVNSTGDGADKNIDDTACDANIFPGIQCTLRAAIEEANDTPGRDLIHFNIPGSGVKTINVGSTGLGGLPEITNVVSIDGYTQPGASPNTLAVGNDAVLRIEINGANIGTTAAGLEIDAANSVVRGLVINRFTASGIVIYGDGTRVEGNFIGTNPTGTLDRGNGLGLAIDGESRDNTIGGTSPEARNLISGNAQYGVYVSGRHNEVAGNYVGTKRSGTGALGNDFSGVFIHGGSNNTIGGASSATANTIARNGAQGVSVAGDTSTGNRILRNSIFLNAGVGIDLGNDGSTPNDPGDPDTGPNNLQNKPVLTAAVTSGGSTTIQVRLDSTPNQTFTVQFFSNPSGTDEGKKFIGQKSVTTNSNGATGIFTFSPSQAVPVGQAITATSTRAGSTSEFSAPRTVNSS